MKIYEYTYNGFFVDCNKEKIMEYTVEFLEWTRDPGVFKGKNSKEEIMYIPTYAIVNWEEEKKKNNIPDQFDIIPKETMVYFGMPGKS